MSDTPITNEAACLVWSEGNQVMGDEYASAVHEEPDALRDMVEGAGLQLRRDGLTSVTHPVLGLLINSTEESVYQWVSGYTVGLRLQSLLDQKKCNEKESHDG